MAKRSEAAARPERGGVRVPTKDVQLIEEREFTDKEIAKPVRDLAAAGREILHHRCNGDDLNESRAYEAAVECIERAMAVCQLVATVDEIGEPLGDFTISNALRGAELELQDAKVLIENGWDAYRRERETREQQP